MLLPRDMGYKEAGTGSCASIIEENSQKGGAASKNFF